MSDMICTHNTLSTVMCTCVVLSECNKATHLPSWLAAGPAAALSLGSAAGPSLHQPLGAFYTETKGGEQCEELGRERGDCG